MKEACAPRGHIHTPTSLNLYLRLTSPTHTSDLRPRPTLLNSLNLLAPLPQPTLFLPPSYTLNLPQPELHPRPTPPHTGSDIHMKGHAHGETYTRRGKTYEAIYTRSDIYMKRHSHLHPQLTPSNSSDPNL